MFHTYNWESKEDYYNCFAEELYWWICEHYFEEWQESGKSMVQFVESDPDISAQFYAFIEGYGID